MTVEKKENQKMNTEVTFRKAIKDQLTANKLICSLAKELETTTDPARRKAIRSMLREAEPHARNRNARSLHHTNWPESED